MKATVILAHPYGKSFNHAIYYKVIDVFKQNNVEVYAHDLYEEGFDPVLSKSELGKEPSTDKLVLQYTKEMLESCVLVFIHPNWWGQPPAIMKGYIDRVFRPPHAYDFPVDDSGGGLPIPKLTGKIGIVFNTSNTEASRENEYFNDPLEYEWIKCVFGFLGIDKSYRKMFRIIADSTEEERKVWLEEVGCKIKEYVVGI